MTTQTAAAIARIPISLLSSNHKGTQITAKARLVIEKQVIFIVYQTNSLLQIAHDYFDNHGVRTQRKPWLLSRRVGLVQLRSAISTPPATLPHEPPRTTRYWPEGGPAGF